MLLHLGVIHRWAAADVTAREPSRPAPKIHLGPYGLRVADGAGPAALDPGRARPVAYPGDRPIAPFPS